jgi:hypothetical protein
LVSIEGFLIASIYFTIPGKSLSFFFVMVPLRKGCSPGLYLSLPLSLHLFNKAAPVEVLLQHIFLNIAWD